MEDKSVYREALEVLLAIEEARRLLLGNGLSGKIKAQDLSQRQKEIFLKNLFSSLDWKHLKIEDFLEEEEISPLANVI